MAKSSSLYYIDYLNILLLGLSCAAAYFLPWQVLLGAYTLLGPAHYLTQISWMHDRQYFTKRKYDFLYLLLLTIAMFMLTKYYFFLLLLSLASAFVVACCRPWRWRLFWMIISVGLAVFLSKENIIIAVLFFVPTIIHVYIFTAGFMLNGALKNNSVPGLVSFMLLIAFGVSFFLIKPISDNVVSVNAIQQHIVYFQHVADYFMRAFGLQNNSNDILSVIRFFAFAYLYHYLNWFSKTGIIQWHIISKARAAVIILLYLCAIGLYAYDYGLGFKVLLSLSFLHVILELPLDMTMLRKLYPSHPRMQTCVK